MNDLWQPTDSRRAVSARQWKQYGVIFSTTRSENVVQAKWQTEKADVRRRTTYVQMRLKAHETNKVTHRFVAAKCP